MKKIIICLALLVSMTTSLKAEDIVIEIPEGEEQTTENETPAATEDTLLPAEDSIEDANNISLFSMETNFTIRHADGTETNVDSINTLADTDTVVLNKDINGPININWIDGLTKFALDTNGHNINAGPKGRPILAFSSDVTTFTIINSSETQSTLSTEAPNNKYIIFAGEASGDDVVVNLHGNLNFTGMDMGIGFQSGSPRSLITNIDEGINFPLPTLEYSLQLDNGDIIHSGSIQHLANNFESLNPIKLNKDSDIVLNTASLNPKKSIKFDLNGHKLEQVFVAGNSITIMDSVGTGVIENHNGPSVYLKSGEFILEGGTIKGSTYPISGNGAESSNTNLIVNGGMVESTMPEYPAIYQPHIGTITVNGGTISGPTAIQLCSGDLIVNGGHILGTSEDISDQKTGGDGPIIDGSAISAVRREGYPGIPNVMIQGGTFTSEQANAVNVFKYDNVNKVQDWNEDLTTDVNAGSFNTSVDKFVDSDTASANLDGQFAVGQEAVEALADQSSEEKPLNVTIAPHGEITLPKGTVAKNESGSHIMVNGETLENGAVTLNEEIKNGTSALYGANTVCYNGKFYATLVDALKAVYMGNQADAAILYCKQGADVGVMTHGHVADNLTIYGNGAFVSGGERDLEIDTYKYDRTTGAQSATGIYLDKDITVNVYDLDGIAAWGQRNTNYTVNLNFKDCENMHRIYFTNNANQAGKINIKLDNCTFDGNHASLPAYKLASVYSNSDGNIEIVDCTFKDIQTALNMNHKASGIQNIKVENTKFIDCGEGVDSAKTYAASIRIVAKDGATSNLTVNNVEFIDNNGVPSSNKDILIGDGRHDAAEKQGITTLAMSNTKAEVEVQEPGYYDSLGNVANESKAKTTSISADQIVKADSDKHFVIESTESNKPVSGGWDDGGPFTTNAEGDVFDRWGNMIYDAPTVKYGANGYYLVNTGDK